MEQLKRAFHLPNIWAHPAIAAIGNLGVVLFFVLSGFLITFLLLEENKRTGTVSIRKFYIRRILRIWPLYYLIVIIGFFVLPHIDFMKLSFVADEKTSSYIVLKSSLLFTLFPNVALAIFATLPFISHIWSIGTEEQFYLSWPWLIKYSGRRKVWVIISVIVGYLGIKFIIRMLPDVYVKSIIENFWDMFNIDCMAVGAFFAYAVHSGMQATLRWVFAPAMQWITLLLTCCLLFTGTRFGMFTREIYALLFAVIIVNLGCNPKRVVSIENRFTGYLGKISYGLYMYHPIAIIIVLKILVMLNLTGEVWVYTAGIVFTIALASGSYHFLELSFIRLKDQFSKVLSGRN